jgi:O-antigen/teichoic acid export membrane protein
MWRRNFFWKLSGLTFGGGLAFVFQLALMRYLGPMDFGRWSLALGWAGLFTILIDYGFNPILTRDLARAPDLAQPYWRAVLKGKLSLSLVAALGLLAVGLLTSPVAFSWPLLLAAFIFLAASSIAETVQSLTYALDCFRLGTALAILQKGLPAAIGFGAMALGAALPTLAGAIVFGSGVALIVSLIAAQRAIPKAAPGQSVPLQPLLLMALPLFLQNLFIVIYFRIDTVMIGAFAGAEQAGLYAAAYRFFELSNIIPTALIAAWIAPLSRDALHEAGRRQFRKAFVIFGGFAAFGFLILRIVAWIAPRYLLGSDYRSVQPILSALSWTVFFYYPDFLLTTMLVLLGRTRRNTLYAGLCALANVVLNLWAIPRYGGIGAAWATLFTEGLLFGFCLWTVIRTMVSLPRGATSQSGSASR